MSRSPTLADLMKKAQKALKKADDEAAAMLNVRTSRYQEYVTGNRFPQERTLRRIAKVFGIDTTDLPVEAPDEVIKIYMSHSPSIEITEEKDLDALSHASETLRSQRWIRPPTGTPVDTEELFEFRLRRLFEHGIDNRFWKITLIRYAGDRPAGAEFLGIEIRPWVREGTAFREGETLAKWQMKPSRTACDRMISDVAFTILVSGHEVKLQIAPHSFLFRVR